LLFCKIQAGLGAPAQRTARQSQSADQSTSAWFNPREAAITVSARVIAVSRFGVELMPDVDVDARPVQVHSGTAMVIAITIVVTDDDVGIWVIHAL
jgi:uncharacterized membrane protein YfbV (UPF0208 family)